MSGRNQKHLPLEIERKFLVKEFPNNIDSFPRNDIVQGYLTIKGKGSAMRLRKKGKKYYQTVKSKGNKIRTEVEVEITPEQFEKLWPLTKGNKIEKTRYEIPFGDLTIELDVYHGQLEGFLSAEVEFKTETESNNFVAPNWLGKEVTENKKYKNHSLALYGIPRP